MRVSTKVEYGILALIDIAINSGDGNVVTANSIAERQNISEKYLEQLLPSLRQARLIRSQKGSRGGYVLNQSAEKITFKEVLNALDINILGSTEFDLTGENNGYIAALDACLWSRMTDSINKCAAELTLADAVSTYGRICGDSDMYYI